MDRRIKQPKWRLHNKEGLVWGFFVRVFGWGEWECKAASKTVGFSLRAAGASVVSGRGARRLGWGGELYVARQRRRAPRDLRFIQGISPKQKAT